MFSPMTGILSRKASVRCFAVLNLTAKAPAPNTKAGPGLRRSGRQVAGWYYGRIERAVGTGTPATGSANSKRRYRVATPVRYAGKVVVDRGLEHENAVHWNPRDWPTSHTIP